MSQASRVGAAVRGVLRDPVERRQYAARLKWLVQGTGGLQAWSFEYRSGLTGSYSVDVARRAPDEEIVIRCPDDCLSRSPLSHLYERRFVYTLPRSVVSTANGATLYEGREEASFVRESISWPYESVVAHGLEIPVAKPGLPEHVPPSVVFPTTANYYHWLVEELPLVLRAHQDTPGVELVSYAPGVTTRHTLVCELLGVTLLPSPLVMRLRNQVLPGRASDSFFVRPEDHRLLHEFGSRLADGHDHGPTHLYVSRKRSRRPLPGEVVVEEALAKRGFTVVYLEEVNWREQASLFRSARVVVGPHGAGLSNLVFSHPGTTLVELTNGQMYNRCFEWIAHVGGHHYVPVEWGADASDTPAQLAGRVLDCV